MTQLSDEVVERVARAIVDVYCAHADEDACNEVCPVDLGAARAAIAAYEAKGDIPVLEG